ncbi:uncharacterized protein YpuA (DUF1002 family) [Geomicrobium halophilum]|uniref:Uncharacterized protein YpuA (DUF1002 family) n=1 Tax=Geomicrobium halophilum TaxID=549000 RepID=A0A841PWX0_9BACL|nr:DUF1002 domain-containing protein [Geomicrobium halophilum]MBB6448863.1 uncharacterized protein YpuA (DUF1002 family) [Geomicrobium halophilum]
MKKMGAWIAATALVSASFAFLPLKADADAAPGDVIITLGEDLSADEREMILSEMDSDENNTIIEVSNEEEHEYLAEFIPAGKIGSNAISSSKITIKEQDTGLDVETNNIDYVSEGMYANALITAGVEDADIYVTAPTTVSGTGALTGLLKAYETEADVDISEEQKRVANEEMVQTADLSERIGTEEATELMASIKEAIAEENVETEEDLRALIERIADEIGVTLSEEEMDGLVSLFERMQNLNIDWGQVQNQIDHIRDNFDDWINREDTQNFLQSVLDFFSELIDSAQGWFDGGTESESS